ncbi:MAG: hypothetical protein ABS42_00500 [Bdellovibrio sp. SCN 50-8]|nr:MAG: hypothetical protein ABS42_00500 [Bdellovibrio sp. SCN 50-8]
MSFQLLRSLSLPAFFLLILIGYGLPTHAQLDILPSLEGMSEKANIITGGGVCSSYSESKATEAMNSAPGLCPDCDDKDEHGLKKQLTDLKKVTEHIRDKAKNEKAEDQFFAHLANQHALELSCAADFAKQIIQDESEAIEALEDRLELARASRRRLLDATKEISSRPEITPKVCPLSLNDLQPSPMLAKDEGYELCKTVITSRLAYDAAVSTIPMANMPALKKLIESYANMKDGDDLNSFKKDLPEKIKAAYKTTGDDLQKESTDLRDQIKTGGGKAFDRKSRYALLSDPRVTSEVLRQSGDSPDVKALACSADARYGKGADSLDNVLMVGSFALSGGAAVVGRVGAAGAKVYQAASAARSSGLMSLATSRTFMLSAAALGADSTALYNQWAKDCGSTRIPSVKVQGSNRQCVSAPSLEQINADNCTLTKVVTALNFGLVGARPAAFLFKKAASKITGARELKDEIASTSRSNAQFADSSARSGARVSDDAPSELGTASGEERRHPSKKGKLNPFRKVDRTEVRQKYIDKYMNRHFTTPQQNKTWIELAESSERGDKSMLFVEVENAAMRTMNKTTKDKDLVTAMTNQHKDILFGKIDELKKKYPGLEIFPYSDPKSSRFAISGDIPKNLEKELGQIFEGTNAQFIKEIRGRGTSETSPAIALIRKSDDADHWFKAGCSSSALWASQFSRDARGQKGKNRLQKCDDIGVITKREKELRQTNQLRAGLEEQFGHTPFMLGPPGQKNLKLEVYGFIRKSDSPGELAGKIKRRFGIDDFSAKDASALIDYYKKVDSFSPPLYVTERKIVNLDSAASGGFSADFIGLGAANIEATAKAIQKARNIDDAVIGAKQGEKAVTTRFQAQKDSFLKLFGGSDTGDDIARSFDTPKSFKDKEAMMTTLASNRQIGPVRVAFIPDGVAQGERSIMSSHGELIADYVRERVYRHFPQKRADQISFGVDMRTKTLNEGSVKAMPTVDPKSPFTEAEQRELKAIIRLAVKDYNRDQKTFYGVTSKYVPAD